MVTEPSGKIRIYSARRIITMNPRLPIASHVAVRDGLILGTGTLDDLVGWGEYELDERFRDLYLVPGFVEGHAHSWEGKAWEDTYVGFLDRTDPSRVVHAGLGSIDAVVERLRERAAALESVDPGGMRAVVGWGLDPLFLERRVKRTDLDRVSMLRPVVIVHQSGHIINVNSKVLADAGITADLDVDGLKLGADGEPTGELMGIALYQAALKAANVVMPIHLTSDDEASVWRFGRSAQIAGVTTVTDLAAQLEHDVVAMLRRVTDDEAFPARLVPAYFGMGATPSDGAAHVIAIREQYNSDKLRFGLVKLIADGSIQGFTARLKAPGYYNGAPNGLWYIDPVQLPSILEGYHSRGLQVHIHTNGDEATEVTLDAIEAVLKKYPSADARFTLQHCQMAHEAHFRRMGRLGVCANLFANHLYYWGDQHHDITMGPERAHRMDATATAKRHGVIFSIHSDAPVTHLSPLFTAWCAVNRLSYSGRLLGRAERLSPEDALHAITLGAACTLKLDHEIGSIEAGKRADFTVLELDPLNVGPEAIRDIPVWGTVLGGRVFSNDALGSA